MSRSPVEVIPDGATWSRTLASGRDIKFSVAQLRQSRTGIHARLEIYDGQTLLAWDQFNIERDSDRSRISNKAHKLLGSPEVSVGVPYLADDMRHDLDLFCREAWPAWMGTQGSELVTGDPDSTVEFLAKPHILENGGTILFGLQGSGKSYTAMLLAVAIDSGTNGLWETRKSNILYVNLERSAKSMYRRLARVNMALGLEPTRGIYMMNRRGRGLTELREPLMRDVEEKAIDLVVVDSISRTGIGDLNENQATNEAIDLLNGLGAAWLGIGHTPRESQDHVYGSTMWDAGADVMLRLTGAKQGDRHGIHLSITKENDLGPQPDLTLAYSFDGNGLKSAAKAKIDDFPELVDKRKKTLPDEIEEFLLTEGAATGTQIAEAIKKPRQSITRILGVEERFVVVKRQGNQVYYGIQSR
jgi:hypothetical protein